MEPICTIWPYKWRDTEGQLLPHCTCASSQIHLNVKAQIKGGTERKSNLLVLPKTGKVHEKMGMNS